MANLAEELQQTKQSLTELLDEVVYFEQQCNVATARGDSISRVLSTSNASHVDAIEVLLSYARALTSGYIDEASSAHATAIRVLRDTSMAQDNAASTLNDLGVSGFASGWKLNGIDVEAVLLAPTTPNILHNTDSNNVAGGPHHHQMETPSIRSTGSASIGGGGGGRVRMMRSGSVLAETRPANGGYTATPSSAFGDNDYAELRINELVAALEAEQNTTSELRRQLSSSSRSSSNSSSMIVGGVDQTPNRVHVTRRGSVEIQVAGNNNSNNSNDATIGETVEALRARVRELEVELADEKVRATGAERERASSVRDRDAAIMDLERAERDRESALQSAKSSDQETDAVREASRRLEREVDLAKRGKHAAERQLSDALVERDRAVTGAERAHKISETAKQAEDTALRQRDDAMERAETERKRSEEANAEVERSQYREDELRRSLAASEQSRSQEISKVERAIQERDAAKTENATLIIERDALRKRLEQSERERSFSMGDAHEAERQRDAAQAQVIAAIEDGERKESQRRAAVSRAAIAEEACVIAQRARKEAEEACRALDASESKARIEAESERLQRMSMTEQLKVALSERDLALNAHRSLVDIKEDKTSSLTSSVTALAHEKEILLVKLKTTQREGAEEKEQWRQLEEDLRTQLEQISEQTMHATEQATRGLSRTKQELESVREDSLRLKRELLLKGEAAQQAQDQVSSDTRALKLLEERLLNDHSTMEERERSTQLEVRRLQVELETMTLQREKEKGEEQSKAEQREEEMAHLTEKREEERTEKENALRREEHERRWREGQESEWRERLVSAQEERKKERDTHDREKMTLKQRITNQDDQLRECMRRIDMARRKEAEMTKSMAQSMVHSAVRTPMPRGSGATPLNSVPRARVRIHRSGSIVIDNDQPIGLDGTIMPPTPGGVVGRGYATLSVADQDRLASAEESRDALANEVSALRARLSLKSALAENNTDSYSDNNNLISSSSSSSSPNAERLHRLQSEMRRLQVEAERTTVSARQQVENVESSIQRVRAQLDEKDSENAALREDVNALRTQILQHQQGEQEEKQEQIRTLEKEMDSLTNRLTHAQHGQAQAQSQLEQATKTLRQARAREQRMERESNRAKEREESLMSSLESVSKKNAQLEIQLHSLKDRVRQLQRSSSGKEEETNALLDDSKRRADTLENELKRMEEQLRTMEEEKRRKEQQDHQQLDQNGMNQEMTRGMKEDLVQYQQLLDAERTAKRELERKVTALGDERQQLAQDMQGAAQHLRLVALQKSTVTHELEQVHTALAELEKELTASRSENDRLRNISKSINNISRRTRATTRAAPSNSKNNKEEDNHDGTPTSRARIHVSRTGSIAITRGDEMTVGDGINAKGPSMIPLPVSSSNTNSSTPSNTLSNTNNVRVRANRHGSVDISRGAPLTTPSADRGGSIDSLVDGSNEPWSIGSDSNVTSIRRGTYFGRCCYLFYLFFFHLAVLFLILFLIFYFSFYF